MESRGRGRRGRGRGTGQPPPDFDPQAFIEAMEAAVTTLAQAGTVEDQGGTSNLQRFKTHHPLTFMGGGDPMVVDIGSIRLKKYWRPWRPPPTRPR